ncbi:16S rRNA (cytidine(1402)-2'-O)-methyltransferase [Psittacicella hinzii]|uniref:Ribosomal RNA small subunit methyltransferase I n=1 Tax=Psittacicella hinzii TaxID=2028575 RepID=A0A3A1Y6A3_9GAMM|nr:16S rRNA (cytidine(1402)-2'-O)-methyltransferase [Psittacicella hinzii]RIY33793.1 16S rRNA (cytidine(1402)-2'-O)-methyltransferase [Psittacicella hinzii]
MENHGTLYIVATPIGNVQDLSPRAVETLKTVDSILCEDTRHSSTLFNLLGINKPLSAYHDHNEKEVTEQIINQLLSGKNIALVSDAGTPLISDPGYVLTKACHENNIRVSPVPGCCAFISALSASGLPSDSFTFYGFLPAKSKQRKDKFAEIKSLTSTAIFYESTHRIEESVCDLIEILGEQRRLCLARELTKQFETIVTDDSAKILEYLRANNNHQKGEFVLIIEGNRSTKSINLTEEVKSLIKELMQELPPKKVTKIVSSSFSLDKDEVYNYIVENK